MISSTSFVPTTFTSPEQEHAHVVAVVRQNPQRKGESGFAYARRVAVLAGLVPPDHCTTDELLFDMNAKPRRDEERPTRLPYKDDD